MKHGFFLEQIIAAVINDFTFVYGYLPQCLLRLNKNKEELLLVLKYPYLPLHNNLSE